MKYQVADLEQGGILGPVEESLETALSFTNTMNYQVFEIPENVEEAATMMVNAAKKSGEKFTMDVGGNYVDMRGYMQVCCFLRNYYDGNSDPKAIAEEARKAAEEEIAEDWGSAAKFYWGDAEVPAGDCVYSVSPW